MATKKKRVWGIICAILLLMFTIGSIGKACNDVIQEQLYYENNNVKELAIFIPPTDWSKYEIGHAFTLSVPPTLELRSEYDKYTEFLNDHFYKISNADAVFQQKDLGQMSEESFNTYCRIMCNTYSAIYDKFEACDMAPNLTAEDTTFFRSRIDEQIKPWSYIKTPTYQWIDLNGVKGFEASYSRDGSHGEVICHYYLFSNYDKAAEIVTAYRKADEDVWGWPVENVVKTFKWKSPHTKKSIH